MINKKKLIEVALPSAEDVKKVERRLKTEQKKLLKKDKPLESLKGEGK